MKPGFKTKLLVILSLATAIFATGCGGEPTPYETNNKDNYTVSVKYDANGGIFTTNTSVIVDSYNAQEAPKNNNGMAEIALLPPDDSARGNDAFEAINNGYFLAGWYSERTEVTDANGNTTYNYSNKWNFEQDLLEVDPNKNYSSDHPVITLYAAWVPLFKIEFYSLGSDELLETYTFNPLLVEDIKIPQWSQETGRLDMFEFPEKTGYTFNKVFTDKDGKEALEGETFKHSGNVNYNNGTAENEVMKVYVDWQEGEWFRIYNAEQFADNINPNGHYDILADLDFSDVIWPTTYMYNDFSGQIKGNGHKFSNISLVHNSISEINAGLFGHITETAEISDVTFENVSFTIKAGARAFGSSYGLFTGVLSESADISNIKILNSLLKIDSSCYFAVDDYSIGLVCGMGNPNAIETAEIECVAVGENPDSVNITVNGNDVTVEISAE